MKYSILYADPAWQYNSKECLAKTSILNGEINTHYPTLTLKKLKALRVKEIAEDNSLLFLWVVSPMLKEGIEVMESWGFNYATIAFVWYKQRSNPGHYIMSECEICLVGKRGKILENRGSRKVRQFLSELRGKHSSKPSEIRNRITEMFPNHSKIELFARERVENWHSWGNEIESDVEIKYG